MARRLISAFVLPFFLVGASWLNGWYPKFGTTYPSRGLPSVYVPIDPLGGDTAEGAGSARAFLVALTDRNVAAALPVPRIKGIRISKRKAKFDVALDLSNRTDFWYWTAIDQSEVVIEFPSIQAFNGKALNTGVEDLVGVIKFEVYQSGRGGRVVVPLKRAGTVQSISLRPNEKTGAHRLVMVIANDAEAKPSTTGQGIAWGGGREIDRVSLIQPSKADPVERRFAATTTADAQAQSPVPAKTKGPKRLTAKPPAPRPTKIATTDLSKKPPSTATNPAVNKPVARKIAPDTQSVITPSSDSAAPMPASGADEPSSTDAAAIRAQASRLAALLKDLTLSHRRNQAAAADLEAARRSAAVTRGSWYPVLNITAHYGYEIQRKDEGVDDTHMPTREIDFKVTQLLWDFGATASTIEQAALTVSQSEVVHEATVQAVLLEAISAHLNYARSRAVLRFAERAERNIKRQAEIEDIRVKRGSGFSSDVLQAKTQLAGAEARRVQTGGVLVQSANRYNAVFGTFPDAQFDYFNLGPADDLLPATLADAVQIAIENNPQIKAVEIAADLARAVTRGVEAGGYYPEFNLITEAKYKEDAAGTVGFKGEQIVRIELTFPFNLGGTAQDTVQASKQAFLSSDSRLGDARDQITERTRVVWQQLETAREVAAFLHNQADIAAEFLTLARKERELGKRSLIEVLAGETALINAAADAASAEIDVSIAAFTLLSAMGNLTADAVAP